jgi:PHAX RNA-binding domain
MKPQKTKQPTKRTKKSPIVSVVVERKVEVKLQTPPPVAVPASPSSLEVAEEFELKQLRKQTVKTLASELGETKPSVLSQLHVIVKKLGCSEALTILAQAQEVEAQGGMMTLKGDRRRTVGGVFFTLVYTAHPELRFHPKKRKKPAEKVESVQPQPQEPTH